MPRFTIVAGSTSPVDVITPGFLQRGCDVEVAHIPQTIARVKTRERHAWHAFSSPQRQPVSMGAAKLDVAGLIGSAMKMVQVSKEV